jgi:predicted porin
MDAGVTLGCSAVIPQLQDRDGDGDGLPGVVDERDLTTWSIGYTYPLSRRTNLYINYSDKDGEQSLNNSTTFDRSQFTVGMRHLF